MSTTQITGSSGYFRIFVQAPDGPRRDVTMFRGAPTQIGQLSSTDPFGDATGSLTFPQITGFDRPGHGDLDWLVPWTNVDIVWYTETGYPTDWIWEGFIVSEEISESGYQVTLKGALYQLDNYLAAPWFPQYPVPYELLIKNAFDPREHPGLRNTALIVEWPEDWAVRVPTREQPDFFWYLRPWGVKPREKWTGRVTRNTGSWDPLLTGHVQGLLSVMYTDDGGQWTVRKRTGRRPVLMVRPEIKVPNDESLHVWYGAHGVTMNLSRDWTQSANIVYGQGSDLSGTTFSGSQVSRDGQTTYYEPFAALPYVWPATSDNPRANPHIIRKEARLQFPQGMSLQDSELAAASHLRKFADPGYTGTLALNTDPMMNGEPYNRMLIRAGQTIVVHGIRGTDLLFHISEATVSPMDLSVNLTLDTKYRDALTVAEVRARTRDALDPVRLLKVGAYSVTVQDQIKPWSYSQGSGVLPSGGAYDATPFFTKRIGANEKFPWVKTAKKYPPKKYPKYYVKIGPKSSSATKNWAGVKRNGYSQLAIPIKMSQAGTIRLTQIAAYDRDGNVKPCSFHVSFYTTQGVGVTDMPMIPKKYDKKYYKFRSGQRYPFFPGAFENITTQGEETDNPGRLVAGNSGMVVGYGNYFERAGYFPGLYSKKDPKTGLLSDETPWSYDTTADTSFDKYDAAKTRKDPDAGLMYVMIYCHDQGSEPIYFMGRLFRSEGN